MNTFITIALTAVVTALFGYAFWGTRLSSLKAELDRKYKNEQNSIDMDSMLGMVTLPPLRLGKDEFERLCDEASDEGIIPIAFARQLILDGLYAETVGPTEPVKPAPARTTISTVQAPGLYMAESLGIPEPSGARDDVMIRTTVDLLRSGRVDTRWDRHTSVDESVAHSLILGAMTVALHARTSALPSTAWTPAAS